MLSSACQDTIRAAVWLSTKPQDEYFHIQKITKEALAKVNKWKVKN